MPKVKTTPLTRKKSEEKYGGGPCDLVLTDPSTYRQLIQYYYYLECADPCTDFWAKVQHVTRDLKSIWLSVNPRLPLIHEKSIDRKVKDLFVTVKDINRKHAKANAKRNLDSKLDKLFDISACSCPLEIVPCNDSRIYCKKDKCTKEHIICVCPAAAKVPIEERAYLRDQRSKTGLKGAFQMSSVDTSTAKRDRRAKLREQHVLSQEDIELAGPSTQPTDIPEQSNSEGEDEWQPKRRTSGDYNLLKFPRYAMELVRAECSSSLGAALGNALLHDIEHLLRPEVDINQILIDKCKLDRAKSKVRVISEEFESETKTHLVCIGVDGKLDGKTLTYMETEVQEGENVLKKCVATEHHLTFTYEDGKSSGTYLTHRTIPVVGATGDVLAQEAFSVLQEYDSIESIRAILLDNTATNTGSRSGLVVKLEEILGRKLHTIGCALHQNELPLRALFKKLDGTTTGPRSFDGPLGKRCLEDIHGEPQVQFETVQTPITDEYIPDEVLKDLSHDQRLLYEYCKGIGVGRVDDRWAAWKIGPLNHARWLTLAIRLLCLYTRDNSPNKNLTKLTHYIVKVYAPSWFSLKISSKLHDSPRILFSTINHLKLIQFDDVRRIVKQNIQGNAFCLLPANFLYAMVKDDEDQIRNLGLHTILTLRRRMNSSQEMEKKIPPVNWDADTWPELIDLTDAGTMEPPTTQHFSDEEIQIFINNSTKPDIPNLPCHSQSVERSVKLVTEASHSVYGFEARHRSILTKLLSRKMRPVFMSKGHYSQSYDHLYT